jgi:hypothetical protein
MLSFDATLLGPGAYAFGLVVATGGRNGSATATVTIVHTDVGQDSIPSVSIQVSFKGGEKGLFCWD